ncbi:MAG: sulfite exporter TauE/SafE family protein [Aestuariivirga sp.]
MDTLTIALLALAAFLGGGLNALAGGGTFFTFPALVMAGLPAIQASPTSAAAILPGYASAAFAYRRHFASDETLPAPLALAASIAGAIAGASILLVISAKAFDWIVPWLLLCATLLFAFDKTIGARLRGGSLRSVPARLAAIFAAGTYGGFFNGGLGIVLLAALRLVGLQDLNRMNGLKSLVSTLVTTASVIVFSLGGLIEWRYALAMMVGSALGGYASGLVAQKLPQSALRKIVITTGFAVSAIFFARAFGVRVFG